MKKTLVLYWPKDGAVGNCAHKIFNLLTAEKADMFNLEKIDTNIFENYSSIIAGGSTVGAENWQDVEGNNQWVLFLKKCKEQKINLEGKKIAVFGLGNQILYPNHFVNDMADIRKAFVQMGAKAHGEWPADGYKFEASKSFIDGKFVGLPLDEVNESEKTDSRIEKWLKSLL